jgi:hypothetical protein
MHLCTRPAVGGYILDWLDLLFIEIYQSGWSGSFRFCIWSTNKQSGGMMEMKVRIVGRYEGIILLQIGRISQSNGSEVILCGYLDRRMKPLCEKMWWRFTKFMNCKDSSAGFSLRCTKKGLQWRKNISNCWPLLTSFGWMPRRMKSDFHVHLHHRLSPRSIIRYLSRITA